MPEKPRFYDATVTQILSLTSTVKHFVLEYDKDADTRFIAGQFLQVHLEKEGKPHRKSYSIASAPSLGKKVELCIKLVEGGFVSTWFFNLKVGDRIHTSLPYGIFVMKEPWEDDLVFVGTGTGIAPLRGMIKDLYDRGCTKRIWLIFGNRYESDILYEPEWRELEKSKPNFKFIPTVSRGEKWTGETAYVQDVARKLFAANLKGKDFYGCGLVPMCKALRTTLAEMGVAKENIHFEQFV